MEKKINLRLMIITLLALVASTIGITLIYYNIFQNQIKEDLRVNAELLADTGFFSDVNSIPSLNQFQDLTRDSLRITWINDDGTVLFDNDTDVSKLENHMSRPEVKAAFETGSGSAVRNSTTLNMNTFYYALRLDNDTVVRVATEAKNMMSVFLSAIPLILGILIIIMIVCLWISRMLTKQLLEPIEQMAENLDDPMMVPVYEELIPFANKIQSQHENILLSAKSRQDFTANVSHELKTPLTAISGYAELIGMGMENNFYPEDMLKKQTMHFSDQIRKNADRLLSVINDIIRLSDLDHTEQERHFEELDLREIAQDTVDVLQVNAHKKKISLTFKGMVALVLGDRELLKELIMNLVQNAIQYNNVGGYVNVSVMKDGKNSILIVEDNGIGIPVDQQERVFERFYRVDKSRSRETGGTGLGLAIVKHIVEIHDARLELDSTVGQGTKFTITF